NSWRVISALEVGSGRDNADKTYRMGSEWAMLDDTVAGAALDGYTALRDYLAADALGVLDRLLRLHEALFFAMIGVLGVIALFIFRPMTEMIRRRTSELVEARNSMAFIAVHDGLTGLNNRIFLRDHFDMLL